MGVATPPSPTGESSVGTARMSFAFNTAVAISNGLTITSAMSCAGAYLYKAPWRQHAGRPLWASATLIGLTLATFAAQVTVPAVLATMRLSDGLMSGEWWRLITPLFVQPYGVYQLLFNVVFLVVFAPLVERLYGSRLWLLFLVSGAVGQLVNLTWRPGGGGSSTEVFGLMGAALAYVLWHYATVPRRYVVLALLGIGGAIIMRFTHDGHGPGLLTGALLGALFQWRITASTAHHHSVGADGQAYGDAAVPAFRASERNPTPALRHRDRSP